MFKKKGFKKLSAFFAVPMAVLFAVIGCMMADASFPSTDVSAEPETYNESFDVNASLYTEGYSLYDPEEYIESRYDCVSIEESVSYMLDDWSYSSQNQLNAYYNAQNDASVSGTCGVVACTSIVYYYATVKGYTDIPADKNTLFAKLIDYYGITDGEGTSSSSYKKAIPWLFSEYGYSMSASRATLVNKYTKMKAKAEDGIPTEFSTSGTERYGSHAMVVVGYRTYTITYMDGSEEKTETETYYALDEGWGQNKPAYAMQGNMPGSWEITTLED